MNGSNNTILVHLASGIGNIVLATPLLRVLANAGWVVDVLLDADYPGVGELLEGWAIVRTVYDGRKDCRPRHDSYAEVLAAVPPFYWRRFAKEYRTGPKRYRPPDDLFYANEQGYYIEFARWLGCEIKEAPYYLLPICVQESEAVETQTLVLAPGCKSGEMANKRWPFFPQLAAQFADVVLVGTREDLALSDGSRMSFPNHVRSCTGQLSLKETARLLASAGAVVANDSGLGHIAGAVGAPTVMLFGPTAHRVLGDLPPNVRVIRRGLSCEPCWFNARFKACGGRIDCLAEVTVDEVVESVAQHVRPASSEAGSRRGPRSLSLLD